MNTKPMITLVLGTAREGRRSEHVALYLKKILEVRNDIRLTYCDVRDFNTSHTRESWNKHTETEKWQHIASESDAFIFVVPEYNWSFPGEFKTLLDQALPEYLGKPCLVAGVSKGRFGGARVIISLNTVFFELGLVHVPYPLFFPHVAEWFESDKTRDEQDAEFLSHVEKSINRLLAYQQKLDGIGDILTQ